MPILLVKTSSLGDVVHNLPAVSDLRRHFADMEIDWMVEESFADIPRLHPAIRRVIPVAARRWRRNLLSAQTRGEWQAFRQTLRSEPYAAVIDIQGLFKSAWLARQARGPRSGPDAASAREAFAACFYDHRYAVDTRLHAVERNRLLVAQAMGYAPQGAADYGLTRVAAITDTAVLLTATSRDDKLWAEAHWIAVGQALAAHGLSCRLPAGSAAERARAERLATAIPHASVVPPATLREVAEELGRARLVIGVDTGLIHLAAALGRPAIALFCASEPTRTGVLADARGAPAINLGGPGSPPSATAVIERIGAML